ncbi:MAG: response regulator [Planctomycetes bacterium]|nr:response regulator [Planctomycetota bacterium]
MGETRRHTLVVVEDDRDNLALLREVFAPEHHVLCASSAEEALELLGSHAVDAVLSDERLPGMSGTGLLEAVKGQDPAIVRLLITAHADLQVALDAINRGQVRRFLQKPCDPRVLRATVRQELEYRDLLLANQDLSATLSAKLGQLEQANETLRVTVRELEGKSAALETAHAALLTLDEMKDNFQANISHELKTPLVAGMGYIELMLRDGLGPIAQQQRHCLEISYRNLVRLVGIIDDLLTFTQIRSRQERLLHTHFSLVQLLRECVNDCHACALDVAAEVELQVPEDLPAILGDRDMIRRVFANLFSNAEKFASGEGVRVRVSARATGKDRIQVSFSDNGIGVPPDKARMIFERFQQIDGSSTRKYNGMGLGLALAREVLNAHGCDILLDTTVSTGTTFLLELPTAQDPRTRVARASGPGMDSLAGGRRSRVLVVDDEQHILDLVSTILERTDLEPVFAHSGAECLELVQSQPVDLVLLDLAMEDMNGLEVCRRIKTAPATRHIPVHMFSAMSDEKAIRDAYEAGCDGYITKPFKVADFVGRIRSILGAPAVQ